MARAAETNRKQRTPISDGFRSRLNVRGKDSNFEYRIVNDVDGRIEQFKEGGWEVVTDESVSIGERRITTPSEQGSARTVSVGNGITGVLMKIKREWWEEDQAAKAAKVKNSTDATLEDARKSGDYGSIKVDRD